MTHFIRDYLLNVAIAMVLLSLGSFMVGEARSLYYQYSDIENFYLRGEFVAFDVCVGDENQSIISGRTVVGTDIGYQAEIYKELLKIEGENKIKVYEESSTPFVEVEGNGGSQRIQRLPTTLEAGAYQWVLYVTLDVYGNDREVIPPLESTIFNVIPCDS